MSDNLFKGRKIPASAWDRWKERWTPNWLRWLFPVSYRIVPTTNVPLPQHIVGLVYDPNFRDRDNGEISLTYTVPIPNEIKEEKGNSPPRS